MLQWFIRFCRICRLRLHVGKTQLGAKCYRLTNIQNLYIWDKRFITLKEKHINFLEISSLQCSISDKTCEVPLGYRTAVDYTWDLETWVDQVDSIANSCSPSRLSSQYLRYCNSSREQTIIRLGSRNKLRARTLLLGLVPCIKLDQST